MKIIQITNYTNNFNNHATKTTIMKSRELLPMLLLAIMLSSSIIMFNQLPDKIPTHWNAQGLADGFGARWTIFIMPIIAVLLYLLLRILPKYDSIQTNKKENELPIYIIATLSIAFLLIIHLASLAQQAGNVFSMNLVIVPAFSFLFIGIGLILPRLKRNFFVGIRTPWTLTDDKVWEKTHEFGGKAFVIAGICTLAGALIIEYALAILLISILTASIITIIYSYRVHKILILNKTAKQKVTPKRKK